MEVKIVVETKEEMERLLKNIWPDTVPQKLIDRCRDKWRLDFAVPGIVEIKDPRRHYEPIYITTRDISAEGLGFLSKTRLIPKQKVLVTLEIENSHVDISAIVAHCTCTVGMYKVGVKFDLANLEKK